jgi:hypothetical protein
VLHEGVVVDMIVPVDEVGTIESTLGALALEEHSNIEPKECSTEGHDDGTIRAVCVLTHVHAADLEASVLVDAHVVELGIAAELHLDYRVGELLRGLSRIRLDQRGLTPGFGSHQNTWVAHAGRRDRRKHMDELKWLLEDDPSGHVDPKPFGEQRRVERGEMLRPALREPTFEESGLLLESLTQTSHGYTFRRRRDELRSLSIGTDKLGVEDRTNRCEPPRLGLLVGQAALPECFSRATANRT